MDGSSAAMLEASVCSFWPAKMFRGFYIVLHCLTWELNSANFASAETLFPRHDGQMYDVFVPLVINTFLKGTQHYPQRSCARAIPHVVQRVWFPGSNTRSTGWAWKIDTPLS